MVHLLPSAGCGACLLQALLRRLPGSALLICPAALWQGLEQALQGGHCRLAAAHLQEQGGQPRVRLQVKRGPKKFVLRRAQLQRTMSRIGRLAASQLTGRQVSNHLPARPRRA